MLHVLAGNPEEGIALMTVEGQTFYLRPKALSTATYGAYLIFLLKYLYSIVKAGGMGRQMYGVTSDVCMEYGE